MSLYNTQIKTIKGDTTTLGAYQGKVLLIVNVASKCGLTPQYAELEALYKAQAANGLEILGFPCNQFLGQEPGQRRRNSAILQPDVRRHLPAVQQSGSERCRSSPAVSAVDCCPAARHG